MKISAASILAFSILSACGGEPFFDTTGGGVTAGTTYSGEVNKFTFDPATDTLSLNNLPFDLSGKYTRDASFDRNGFKAYRNVAGGNNYVALYAEGAGGKVGAGVVGTDDYLDYGYGGSVLRTDGATLPSTGEAVFDGDYAGIRVYEGDSGIHGNTVGTSDGTVSINMDFDDFDVVGAIDIIISNRHAYDSAGVFIGDLPYFSGSTTGLDGLKIKQTNITEINPDGSTGGSGTLDGIMGGTVGSGLGGQIAGIVLITSPDAASGLNVKETGAFLATQTSFMQ